MLYRRMQLFVIRIDGGASADQIWALPDDRARRRLRGFPGVGFLVRRTVSGPGGYSSGIATALMAGESYPFGLRSSFGNN